MPDNAAPKHEVKALVDFKASVDCFMWTKVVVVRFNSCVLILHADQTLSEDFNVVPHTWQMRALHPHDLAGQNGQ